MTGTPFGDRLHSKKRLPVKTPRLLAEGEVLGAGLADAPPWLDRRVGVPGGKPGMVLTFRRSIPWAGLDRRTRMTSRRAVNPDELIVSAAVVPAMGRTVQSYRGRTFSRISRLFTFQ